MSKGATVSICWLRGARCVVFMVHGYCWVCLLCQVDPEGEKARATLRLTALRSLAQVRISHRSDRWNFTILSFRRLSYGILEHGKKTRIKQ